METFSCIFLSTVRLVESLESGITLGMCTQMGISSPLGEGDVIFSASDILDRLKLSASDEE